MYRIAFPLALSKGEEKLSENVTNLYFVDLMEILIMVLELVAVARAWLVRFLLQVLKNGFNVDHRCVSRSELA